VKILHLKKGKNMNLVLVKEILFMMMGIATDSVILMKKEELKTVQNTKRTKKLN
jgi:hypothetical protein